MAIKYEKMISGRSAIAKDLSVAPNPARRFRFDIESIQIFAPNAALADVSYFGTEPSPNGHTTYVLVKRESRWLIRAARVSRYPEAKP